MGKLKIDKIVPDTSVLIDGVLSKMIESGELEVNEIIIHNASMDELIQQAAKGRETGFIGLEEVKKLQKLAKEKGFKVRFAGRLPTLEEIKLAKSGRIDSMIRDLALEEDAVLVTSDRVQALAAEAYGCKVYYIEKAPLMDKLTFEQWFDENTASLHIKENVPIMRKKGKPGEWYLEFLDVKLDAKQIENIALEILEAAKIRPDGFIEIERPGSIIVQLGKYRIVIVKPPVSDGWEITIVRPLKKLKLEDYNLSEKLLKRLEEKAEGILIAGAPGHGKTTFAQALAEWYASKGKIVKTVESPRDLQVEDIITQYSKNFATSQEIHDILLLARPDYVVFDEMRDTPDFKLYVDLRLAGVGMIGVVHATEPIEAIQRFIGRIDVGMIPQVVDTIIFIRKGRVEKVYELKLVVKVPTGMTAEDLARPVVEVRNFETGELEYEIYVFGEETMIVPVKEVKIQKTPTIKLLEKLLIEKFRKLLHTKKVKVEVAGPNRIIVWVPEEIRPRLIGRKGKTIEALERAFGVKITVKTFEEEYTGEVEFEIEETKNVLLIRVPEEIEGRTVNIYVGDKLLFTATVGKKGRIRLSKRISIAQELLKALREGRNVKVVVT